MPHFQRRTPAPPLKRKSYQGYRLPVREDFRATCAYCLLEETWAAGLENFELDHFRPQTWFPELARDFYNLYWSCHVCNRIKGAHWPSPALIKAGIGFVDLCAAEFDDHFIAQPDGAWRGKTPSANYTIDSLRLNRPHLMELRRLLAR